LAGDDTLVKTGLHLDVRNKDTLIRATSCWIGELGEVEMTLRSNPEWLKAFITAETDRYRVPYGKCDVNYPRRTSFIATCNSDEFLVDETGSRRFWVVALKEKFDLDRLKKFDVKQLWRQVEFEIAESGKSYEECFRLSKATLTELQERNCRFNAKMTAQSEIEDLLLDAQKNPDKYRWEWTTTTRFKEAHDALKRFNSNQVGKALKAVLGDDTKDMRLPGVSHINKGCRNLPFVK
jgi:predicted P-loop ATPase